MDTLDFVIVLAFVAYACLSGLRARRQASRDLEQYFLAGRTLKGWQAGLSMAATQFAADTPLNVVGIIAISGIFALWQLWIYTLAFLFMGFVLAASWRGARVVTDAELAELRYGGRTALVLRVFKALYFGTLFNCIVLAWVFFAGAKIAEPFLLWDEWLPAGVFEPVVSLVRAVGVTLSNLPGTDPDVWRKTASNLISILLILAVTAFYSATGGLRSVVRTDIVQFSLMMIGTVVLAGLIVNELGGLDAMTESLRERFDTGGPGAITAGQILAFTPSQAKDATLSLLFLFALQWLIQLNADGTGYLAQRSMACRSARDAKIAAVVFTVAQILVRSLVWLPIGIGLLLLYPPDPAMTSEELRPLREASYVMAMADLLPAGVKGLLITAMLAALASTVDTHLNWGASYWANDLYKRLVCETWLRREPDQRTLVWVARGANLLLIAVALVVMTQLESINRTWELSLLLGAGVGVVLVLRWLWWRVNGWAEIAAVASSLVVAFALMTFYPDMPHASKLLLLALISTAAAVIAVVVAGPEERYRLVAFYERARPPGFWGPVARDAGQEPARDARRLGRGVLAMVVCAVSVFCLLIGIGTWLVDGTPPTWLPHRTTWIALCIGVGLVLVPVWWRAGFGAPDELK